MDLIKIQDAIRLEYDRKLENLVLTEAGAVLKMNKFLQQRKLRY